MPRGGKRRSWTDEQLIKAVETSDSMAEVMRKLGLTATTNRAVRGRIVELNLDTSGYPILTFGKPKVFHETRLREVVASSTSYSQVVIAFGCRPVGSMIVQAQRQIERYRISTAHFQRTTAGRAAHNRLRPEDVLVLMPPGRSHRQKAVVLRRAMLASGVPHRCAECGNPGEWRGKLLVLDVDHVNGEWLDNRLKNLRFLCPNCHTQTDTWRTMNIKRRKRTVGDLG